MLGTTYLKRLEAYLNRFSSDIRAVSTGGIAGAIIGIAVGALVMAYTLPSAISALFNANTTGWSTDATNMWSVTPVIIILAGFILFVSVVIYKTRK